ncbi:alanine racemase [Cellulomonas sp. PhB143]|uniref:alanine racemase n=1 Tax=Cellulomonas sp. PhB143 TaxID=2485186 RepID=UPI000F475AF4|nr:alanine racemase [Cellulomonas sp. PhB143]
MDHAARADRGESLGARLTAATSDVAGPVAVVDLDRFDANARSLVTRAGRAPVRVASKSVRVAALVERALADPTHGVAGVGGFAGVMAFSLAEALWLVERGTRDVLVAYPTVDRRALARLAASAAARAEITLMVDDVAHVALLAAAVAAAGEDTEGAAGPAEGSPVQVCLDVDASLRLGRGRWAVHLGTRRSPLRTPGQAAALAARVAATPGLHVRGAMFYEAQVAGLQDSSAAVRAVKRASVADLAVRRGEVVAAVADAVGHPLELVNSGGTGSLETSAADPVVTEVSAGSGLFVPTSFDGYRAFEPLPAAFFGLDVVRVPAPGWATLFAGGYAASGKAGPSRLPRPAQDEGWSLTGAEGAGEVQTPLRRGRGARRELAVGDRVWFRHAKAGEMMERFASVHLVRGRETVEVVPTYRGDGHCFG